jgi:serine protease Do
MTDSLGSSPEPDRTTPMRGDRTHAESSIRQRLYSSPTPPSPNETATRRLTWFLVAITSLLLLRFLVPYFAEQIQYAITRGKQRAQMDAATIGLESLKLDELSKAYQMVSQRVAPSVVNITVASIVEQPANEFSAIYGTDRRASQGQGSGVVVDKDGYILTNNHVIEGAVEILVSLSDGRVMPAEKVGGDDLTDLALLKVDADNLVPAEWGDSDDLEVGALVWAVGSPFGLQHSITSGIVSGKNRQGAHHSVYYDFLQTDAAVNPGNSGGPLVDARGRVVGINTAILGEAFRGISFAIPGNEAHGVFERLRADGRVARGWLGVRPEDVDPSVAPRLGYTGKHGALVREVVSGSPAQSVGLRIGDIVLKWDGREVTNGIALSRLVARTKIGSTVDAVVWRKGEMITLQVTVGARPPERK